MSISATVAAAQGYVAPHGVLASRAAQAMAARVGSGGSDASTSQAVAQDKGEDQGAYPRYVSPVFEYNQDAERLVMMFRNPSTGKAEDQIPSEVALKQYQESARRSRKQRQDEFTGINPVAEKVKTAETGVPTGGDSSPGTDTAKSGPGVSTTSSTIVSTDTAAVGERPAPVSVEGTTPTGGASGGGGASVRFNVVV